MEKKIFIIIGILFTVILLNKPETKIKNDEDESKAVPAIEKKIEVKNEVKKNKKVVAKNVVSKTITQMPVEEKREEEGPSFQEEDEKIEAALATYEAYKQIPGARELLEEMQMILENNPNEITFEAFGTEGLEWDENSLEKMIPNPEVREKYTRLMKILVNHFRQGIESEPSEEFLL